MSSINFQTLNERKEELDEFFAELVQTYLDDAKTLIDDVLKAVGAADAAALSESAHALKSSSGYMGADKVVELSASLETMGRDKNLSDAQKVCEELVTELADACQVLEQQKQPA